jgi:hypothetical protein
MASCTRRVKFSDGSKWCYPAGCLTTQVVVPAAGAAGAAGAAAFSIGTAPTRRPTTGDRVVLSAGYRSVSDAVGGPLKPGDVGTIETDDGSSAPWNVRFGTKTWWYGEAALIMAPPVGAGAGVGVGAGARAEVRGGTRRPIAGDRVVLTSDYEMHADAADGPMGLGDVGAWCSLALSLSRPKPP